MITRIARVGPNPSVQELQEAQALLSQSEVVALPTETVYGLAARAMESRAVEKIYRVKGRPSNNPLIVHISTLEQAQLLTTHWTKEAEALTRAFWPGPLTIVLEGTDSIPRITTGGLATIALRCPAHPVMRLLAGWVGPLAAPSANSSGHISPTRAEHVFKDLNGKIPLIVDGGPCQGGIESTVVDARRAPVQLLRPGSVTVSMLEAVVGKVELLKPHLPMTGPLISPGQLEKHYSPRTPALWVEGNLAEALVECGKKSLRYGILSLEEGHGAIALGTDPAVYAQRLYEALHQMDEMGLDRILVIAPPDRPEWLAVRDRLRRATTC